MSLSYGYNKAEENASPYDVNAADYDGRNQPYISGRRNIRVYSGIPHITSPDAGGTTLEASYGDGVEITRFEGTGNGGNALELTEATINAILESPDHRAMNLTYEAGQGPISISVVDPVKIPKGTFMLKLMEPVVTNAGLITSYSKWSLIDAETGYVTASSNEDILVGTEVYISSLGLNIKVKQVNNPGEDPTNILSNGLISSSIEFENVNDRWLTGLADRDDEGSSWGWGLNWIRSGSYTNDDLSTFSDYNQIDDPNGAFEGAVMQTNNISFRFFDVESNGGTWAPYRFASYFNDGPGLSSSVTNQSKLINLNSVDIVFTNDTSKWTRSCVVEAQDDETLSIGQQEKMGLRKSPSVGKDGLPDASGTIGMGWFPGYAIDIETGERLNIIFAEDSWQTSENGSDMIWNPTSEISTEDLPQFDPTAPIGEQFSNGNYLLGGKHFVYVVNGKSWVKGTNDYINGDFSNVNEAPNYDKAAWIHAKLLNDVSGVGKWRVFQNVSWCGIPLLSPGRTLKTDLGGQKNDAKIKLRVTKPYKQYETVAADKILDRNAILFIDSTYVVAYQNSATTWGGKAVFHDGNTYQPGDSFVATTTVIASNTSANARVIEANPINLFSPTYGFSTDNIVATTGDLSVAKDAMELINAVPNPYYGNSSYEVNQLDNRVKITNLPEQATISIFTVSGTLVRKIKKDDSVTSVDWDLKNDYGIPIASGLYIIHVNAPGIGE